MSQVSLYLDDDVLKRVRRVAAVKGESISAWVRQQILHGLQGQWPEGYFDLFGALADENFKRPPQGSMGRDLKRESL